MATVDVAIRAPQAETAIRRSAGLWADAWYRFRKDRVSMAAVVVLLVLLVLSVAAPVFEGFVNYRFDQQSLIDAYSQPTLAKPQFVLGGDEIGRSQFIRLLYGGRVSLAVGFFAALVQLTIGVTLGLTAGYLRGFVDDFITFSVTVLNSIPTLFLLLIIAALFTPGTITLIVILGMIGWTGIANFVRGQTFALREREFINAAKSIGASSPRIMIKHLLPNILPLIFVLAAIDIGTIILIESGLSYLGLGIQPPTPSWGNMLTNAVSYLNRAQFLVYGPVSVIFITVLCLYLIGDGLRDALDPRLKGS